MSITVRILIWLLSLIVIFMGLYLWNHRNKAFLVFHPEKHLSLSIILKIISLLLLLSGSLTLVASFQSNTMFFITMMLIDVFLVSILSFILMLYVFVQ